MQYAVQLRRPPTAGYGPRTVGFFPMSGPGVLDSRRISPYTLPGGIGAVLPWAGTDPVYGPAPASNYGPYAEGAYDSTYVRTDATVARQEAAEKAATDPMWGNLFQTIMQAGTTLASSVITAEKDKYVSRKTAQGASSSAAQADADRAVTLAMIAQGRSGAGYLPHIALGAAALIAIALIMKKR